MKTLMAICAAAALVAAGCAGGRVAYMPDEKIRAHVATDPSMPVKVSNLAEAENAANGFMQIAVTFANYGKLPAGAYYKCEWYDPNGMLLPTSLKQWNEIVLGPGQFQQVRFSAPNAQSKSYIVKLYQSPL